MKQKLYELAHARSGDKSELTTVSLFLYDESLYSKIESQITESTVKQHFAHIAQGKVDRYELPQLAALHFVLHQTRPGGVGAALDFDAHGKSLSWYLLEMEVEL
ncbi:AtuA-related protein [Alkalicoccobacillus porphyridii]|uniref:AtuA-like ferredoxin-fold domain-containing protein n=1 Tax=Alkalicoccobacillus porphyridii TaxID=2597270 RepID=A0A553ZYK5_9BACI|nr:hypothetical protein [Alkalicoccobacillus porphyridii]TSB46531.1 hypothetical protein FN960_09195 [Alkalicoccobacillus porphyridii]